MDNINYCLLLLKSLFKIEATSEDVGYESIVLECEELDTNLLPEKFVENLIENEILLHSYTIEEYVVFIITSMKENDWKLVGILKENELMYSHIPE